MVFSSIMFLFIFLPTLIIYYAVPFKFKNFIIIILSLIFYSWGEPRYFFIMIFSIIIDFILAIIIENNRKNLLLCKLMVVVSIVFNIGLLFFFKYYNFFIDNINFVFGTNLENINLTLPLGISFFVFQTLSYTIDIYRNKVAAERNLINFAAFVVLFPQLIAGPIVRYTDINEGLKYRTITFLNIQDGIRMFILGLAKKVLIANNIGALWTTVESIGFSRISSPLAWLSIMSFGLQIYFDFSGYSFMAIGLGKMLGFEFPPNFNYPYISRSVTEFWRRWHMTLGLWFKEYLYIPLGGSRCSKAKMCLNLFIVWFVTGFWHGANWNFILWGLFFFVFLIIEKFGLNKFLEKYKILSHLYLLVVVLIGWTLFAIIETAQLKTFFIKLFSFNLGIDWVYYLRNYSVIFILGIIFSTPILNGFYKKITKNIYLDTLVSMVLLILCIAYLVDASYNPFLYFRF